MQNAHAIPIASVDTLDTPAPAAPATRGPGRRFGRTALIIHLLALFSLGAAWALMIVLGVYSPEAQAVQGVGGAATLTCAIWSGILALRGIWRGERVALPILVLFTLSIEALVPCMWLWMPLLAAYNPLTPLYEFALWIGLPLFVPFFVFGSFIAVPLAWLVARVVEWRKRKPDEEAWSRRRRLKYGLVVYLAVFAVLLTTIFPYPLFAYAALEQSHRKYWQPPFKWQAVTLRWMPNYVRTGMDEFACNHLPWRYVRHRVSLIEKGQLPEERLIADMEDPWEEIQAAAWRTYFRERTAEAIGLCEEMEQGPAGFPSDRTYSIWQARMSFRDWPIQQRLRWTGFLLRSLESGDFRVRRAAARVTQACIPGADDAKVPWPWNRTQPPEQPGERAAIGKIKQVAANWIAKQHERRRKK